MGCEMLSVFDHEITMRDGVILRGNLYRPAGTGRFPVLLLRSVFRKDHMSRAFAQYDPSFFVRNGYAVYIQDVRGLGRSDGEFVRFTADSEDGYDTVEALAKESWCTGSVGMIGSYYSGYLQLMAADANPPHLKAIAPMQTSVSINRDCDNRGFMFFSHIGWNMSRLLNRLCDGRYSKEITDEWLPKFRAWIKDYPVSQLSVWPARDMPALKDTPFQQIRDYFKHLVEGYDDFELLHKEGRDMNTARVKIPAFYIAGWFDSSRTPLVDHCMAQRQAGTDSHVLIAPWQGADTPARPDSALESGYTSVDVQKELLDWFDVWLKGTAKSDVCPVRYYDITTGKAYNGEVWPPKKTETLSLYLSQGNSLAPSADGSGSDTSFNDPRNPLYYRGYGRNSVKRNEDGSKEICYISQPLDKPLLIAGLPSVKMYISSTARDADFMVSLCSESENGSTFSICDGAVRARYRNGWESEPLEDGEIVPVEVLLGNVYYTVPAGSRLFIKITNSAFPKYDVNHGTAARPADDADGITSTQTVYYGDKYPSAVIIPHM